MQVRLKVVGGKNDGREIRIAGPEFVIGRGDDAHLKPSSELVSRRHCAIRIENKRVIISDEGSRNGTFVNGNQINEPHIAQAGDMLRVGRLQFEMVIDVAQPSDKRPAVSGVADVVARGATNKPVTDSGNIEDSISDWLSEDSDVGRAMQDTTQLSIEDTKAILAEAERKAREKDLVRQQKKSGDSSSEEVEIEEESSKGPRKLPNIKRDQHENSKGAADDVLRKFFKRR